MPDLFIKDFGGKGTTVLSFTGTYKPGDPPPTGYNDWHAWAEVQGKAGLKQTKCGVCLLWKFPQELSDRTIVSEVRAKAKKHGGKVAKKTSPACLKCANKDEPCPK